MSKFTWAVDGDTHINSGFRTQSRPTHNGIDIRARNNRAILAIADGVVIRSDYQGDTWRNTGWGNVVQIKHSDGLTSLYAHCSERKVEVGQSIKQGEIIALAGSTGGTFGSGEVINGVRRSTGHLHLEVMRNGQHINPMTLY